MSSKYFFTQSMILIYVEIKKELEIKPVDFELSMPVQYH